MRMEGYDAKGQLVKRFEVVSAPGNRGSLVPETNAGGGNSTRNNQVRSRSYLEIKK